MSDVIYRTGVWHQRNISRDDQSVYQHNTQTPNQSMRQSPFICIELFNMQQVWKIKKLQASHEREDVICVWTEWRRSDLDWQCWLNKKTAGSVRDWWSVQGSTEDDSRATNHDPGVSSDWTKRRSRSSNGWWVQRLHVSQDITQYDLALSIQFSLTLSLSLIHSLGFSHTSHCLQRSLADSLFLTTRRLLVQTRLHLECRGVPEQDAQPYSSQRVSCSHTWLTSWLMYESVKERVWGIHCALCDPKLKYRNIEKRKINAVHLPSIMGSFVEKYKKRLKHFLKGCPSVKVLLL